MFAKICWGWAAFVAVVQAASLILGLEDADSAPQQAAAAAIAAAWVIIPYVFARAVSELANPPEGSQKVTQVSATAQPAASSEQAP